jgi:hypothetical protein
MCLHIVVDFWLQLRVDVLGCLLDTPMCLIPNPQILAFGEWLSKLQVLLQQDSILLQHLVGLRL